MRSWTRSVPVHFSTNGNGGATSAAGAARREGPMTWGQRHIWRITSWLDAGDPYFNLPWVLPLTTRLDQETLLAHVRALVERHESLRTTVDGDTQRVRRSGTLAVDVFDASDGKPMTVAREVAAELAAKPFDYATDLPLRCAVVMAGERPRALCFAFSHFAVDAASIDVLSRDFRALAAGRVLPPPGCQPLDLLVHERDCGRALRHWRSTLERAPRAQLGAPVHEPEPERFVRVGLESVPLAHAVSKLARRWSVSTTTVLLTACAVTLARTMGNSAAVLQVIVANRHDERLHTMVGALAQDGLFTLDVPPDQGTDPSADPGAGLGELVRQAHRRAVATYRHAHYDPAAVTALREEFGTDLSAYFNDVRTVADWPDLPAEGETRLFTQGTHTAVDASVFFATGPATHTCQLFLLVDTAYLTRSTAFEMLRGAAELILREL